MSNQSRRGKEWETTRKRILIRDDYVCGYGCGREATTVDHITPIDLGGTDEDANLIAACIECNGRKSNRMIVRLDYVNNKWLKQA